jgi:hypothetical protein
MLWSKINSQLEMLKLENYLKLTEYQKDILLEKLNSFKQVKKEESETEKEKNKLTENDSEILNNNLNYLFKKPWEKLANPHKIVKIREYVNSLSYSKTLKLKLEKGLLEKLKNKSLKKEDINYDMEMGKIISLNKKLSTSI